MAEPKPFSPIRRIVTGHDEHGVAKVLWEDHASNAKPPRHGAVSTLVWCSEATPVDISAGETTEDMGARILGTAPPPRGTRDRLIRRQQWDLKMVDRAQLGVAQQE